MAACRTLFIVGDEGECTREEEEDGKERTLVEAIKDKYCKRPQEIDLDTLPVFKLRETSPKSKPGAIPVEKQTHIVLENNKISSSGLPEELASLCPNVVDLHMPKNLLKDWENVFTIMSSMPSLEIFNLTRNEHMSTAHSLSLSPLSHQSLKTLHLSCTFVPFSSLVSVLPALPNLSELHLSRNSYTDSDLTSTSTVSHASLTLLYLVENNISQWTSIEAISELFPNLTSLILNTNPICDVTPPGDAKFQSLQTLNLNESGIKLWESVESLSSFPRLRNLSMQRVPVGETMMEKERRYAIIARLPLIEHLNKSYVYEEERLDAERWLIREFDAKPDKPLVYQSLLEKHGYLQPLVEVDLTPKRHANIEFEYEGIERERENLTINLMQTTKQLRSWVGKTILVPPSKLRLFYTDSDAAAAGCYGSEEMRYDSKMLHSYNMKDGDAIEVVVKR